MGRVNGNSQGTATFVFNLIELKELFMYRHGLLCVMGFIFAASCVQGRADNVVWERQAAQFDRGKFIDPAMADQIRQAGNLSGLNKLKGLNKHPACGWVEYDMKVPRDGWYELWILPSSYGQEYFIDGRTYIYSRSRAKLSNIYLTSGQHTLRIQRWIWTGLGAIKTIRLTASQPTLSQRLRISCISSTTVLRKGAFLKLLVEAGDCDHARTLNIVVERDNGKQVASIPVSLPASATYWKITVKIPGDAEGFFKLTFAQGDQPIFNRDVPSISFSVIDTTLVARPGGDFHRKLIASIDCATQPPDYFGGGATRVIHQTFGDYRESGDVGFRSHMNATDPSWFAYTVKLPQAGRPYLVEVDYPDDALRTFLIVIRERLSRSYPTAGGVDSGGEFSLSHKMQTQSLIHWARTRQLRVILLQPTEHLRAAAEIGRAHV